MTNWALLVAVGITPESRVMIPGVSVALSEADVHWSEPLATLQDRGMHGGRLIVSDDHKSPEVARMARFPGMPCQRRQFYLAKNLLDYLPSAVSQSEISTDPQALFNTANRVEAGRLLELVVKSCAEARSPARKNAPEGFTVFDFPVKRRRWLRTINGLGRLNRGVKRRTCRATLIPNGASSSA